MKILIAEDNDSKFARIKDCLEDNFDNVLITRFTYAKGVVIELKTLDDLNKNDYDLLIQDMQMPLNSDGRIDIGAGMYVLNQLNYREIKIKTICCSSESQDVPDEVEFVLFSYTSSSWRKDLINKIKNHKGNLNELC